MRKPHENVGACRIILLDTVNQITELTSSGWTNINLMGWNFRTNFHKKTNMPSICFVNTAEKSSIEMVLVFVVGALANAQVKTRRGWNCYGVASNEVWVYGTWILSDLSLLCIAHCCWLKASFTFWVFKHSCKLRTWTKSCKRMRNNCLHITALDLVLLRRPQHSNKIHTVK